MDFLLACYLLHSKHRSEVKKMVRDNARLNNNNKPLISVAVKTRRVLQQEDYITVIYDVKDTVNDNAVNCKCFSSWYLL